MSFHVYDVGELVISVSAGPCSCCSQRCAGVTFNSTEPPAGAVLARFGVRCGCWDKFLRLVGDCLVCRD